MLAANGSGGKWHGVITYPAGRILVYILLGALLGTLGLGASLWNAQGYFSVASGVLLLVIAGLRWQPERWLLKVPAYGRFQFRLRGWVSGLLSRQGSLGRFGLGCCNGLLPCGLVYLAVVGAANASSPLAGAAVMGVFGLGTLPLLLVTLFTGRRLLSGGSELLTRWSPVLVAISGLLLLWRGWHSSLPVDFRLFQDLAFPPMCF
jgi:sulfite exporter TauE/SafE